MFAYEGSKQDSIRTRDYMQAYYINEVLKKYTDEKILIHCGYGHLIEVPDSTAYPRKLMGYHLKEMSGIDPLTINQYVLAEGNGNNETPLYQEILLEYPAVFVHQKENFKGFDIKGYGTYSFTNYHPGIRTDGQIGCLSRVASIF